MNLSGFDYNNSSRNKESDLDILVVTFNSEKHLEQCIERLKDALPFSSINVVDNASTDSSWELLNNLQLNSLKQNISNRMLSSEWNIFARESSKKFIMLINPDVFIYNGKFIADAIDVMANDERIAISGRIHSATLSELGAWCAPVRPEDRYVFLRLIESCNWINSRLAECADRSMLNIEYADGCCIIIRRSALLHLGGFSEELPLYFNDTELSIRMLDHNYLMHSLWENGDGNLHHIVGDSSSSFLQTRVNILNNAKYNVLFDSPLLKNLTVSVVLPTFNHVEFLPQAVDALLVQTFSNFELIIVNDGSTDNTQAYLETLIDARIKIIHRDNGGLPSALNEGFSISVGEYRTWTSADNVTAPTWLEKLVSSLDAAPATVGLVISGYADIDERGRLLSIHRGQKIEYDRMVACNAGIASFMYRSSIAEQVGEYDTTLTGAEDWDMWLRILDVCDGLYVDDILYYYRLHANSMTSTMRVKIDAASVAVVNKLYHSHGDKFDLNLFYPRLRFANNPELANWQAKTRLAVILMGSPFCPAGWAAVLLLEALHEMFSTEVFINLILLLCRCNAWDMAVQAAKDFRNHMPLSVINPFYTRLVNRDPTLLNDFSVFHLPDDELVFKLGREG